MTLRAAELISAYPLAAGAGFPETKKFPRRRGREGVILKETLTLRALNS